MYWRTKGTSKHSKEPSPKNLPNIWMKVESKSRVGGKNKKGNKAFKQNNEWMSQMPPAHPPT